MDAFADTNDIAAVWRPLTVNEAQQAEGLLAQASVRLRAEVPNIDALIATDTTGVKAGMAKAAVVNAVKRVLMNPDGLLSTSFSIDDYSEDNRRDSSVSTGLLYIDSNDLVGLLPRARSGFRTINLRATI